MNIELQSYKQTRVNLTLLYFGIILVIVAFFSTIIMFDQSRELDRLERVRISWETGNASPVFQPIVEQRISQIESIVNEIKLNTVATIVVLDTFILLTAFIVSYYLAAQTLKPIMRIIHKQQQFIADASHELKTPITTIKAETEVVLKEPKVAQTAVKDYAKSVLEETNSLSDLVNQLLQIAKSDNGVNHTEFQDVDITKLLSAEVEKFQLIAQARNIKLSANIQSKLKWQTNPDKFCQLLKIVLDNAVKYNKEKGSIKISAEADADKLKVDIADTGIGISKQDLPHIFDRFYRAATDRHEPGFGLGLAIAKQLCNELHADISVDSEPGKGTQVHIVFYKV